MWHGSSSAFIQTHFLRRKALALPLGSQHCKSESTSTASKSESASRSTISESTTVATAHLQPTRSYGVDSEGRGGNVYLGVLPQCDNEMRTSCDCAYAALAHAVCQPTSWASAFGHLAVASTLTATESGHAGRVYVCLPDVGNAFDFAYANAIATGCRNGHGRVLVKQQVHLGAEFGIRHPRPARLRSGVAARLHLRVAPEHLLGRFASMRYPARERARSVCRSQVQNGRPPLSMGYRDQISTE